MSYVAVAYIFTFALVGGYVVSVIVRRRNAEREAGAAAAMEDAVAAPDGVDAAGSPLSPTDRPPQDG